MRITKYLHSCLLIEDQEKTVIVDPGIFTEQEKVLDVTKLANLDYIAITHEHSDHMSIPLIKKLVKKFPAVLVVSTGSVKRILKAEGIKVSTVDNDDIVVANIPHEKLFGTSAPQNILVNVFRKLSHPGDSLHIIKTLDILALPITAPWGSTTWAFDTAVKLNPKIVIPIHDYMWKDEIRFGIYTGLEKAFTKQKITFLPLETGKTVEV